MLGARSSSQASMTMSQCCASRPGIVGPIETVVRKFTDSDFRYRNCTKEPSQATHPPIPSFLCRWGCRSTFRCIQFCCRSCNPGTRHAHVKKRRPVQRVQSRFEGVWHGMRRRQVRHPLQDVPVIRHAFWHPLLNG